jgi:hypothetical protein
VGFVDLGGGLAVAEGFEVALAFAVADGLAAVMHFLWGGEVLVGRGGSSFVTKCVSEYTEFCFVCYSSRKF